MSTALPWAIQRLATWVLCPDVIAQQLHVVVRTAQPLYTLYTITARADSTVQHSTAVDAQHLSITPDRYFPKFYFFPREVQQFVNVVPHIPKCKHDIINSKHNTTCRNVHGVPPETTTLAMPHLCSNPAKGEGGMQSLRTTVPLLKNTSVFHQLRMITQFIPSSCATGVTSHLETWIREEPTPLVLYLLSGAFMLIVTAQ